MISKDSKPEVEFIDPTIYNLWSDDQQSVQKTKGQHEVRDDMRQRHRSGIYLNTVHHSEQI